MATPVFVDGVPARIDEEFFRRRYGQSFPDLLPWEMDDFLLECINDIYTMFHGVGTLWELQDEQVWFDKTQMCYGLLLAWYIADLYPRYAVGVVSSGGIPVRQKSIGGVKLTFGNPDADGTAGLKQYKDTLAQLKSNSFGYKAYSMINSAVSMAKIRGRKKNAI